MNECKIITGDSIGILKTLPEKSINTCVTSPPYYGLRDYGIDGQIGLEDTPEEYIEKLVAVFRQVHRVLKDDGTLWINIGDSYAGGQGRWGGLDNIPNKQASNRGSLGQIVKAKRWHHGIIKPKDIIGIPWMLAFALRADGWYLRQDIIWHKPNPMPESVTDRCTKSHEYIFLLSKCSHYYFDAESISEPITKTSLLRYSQDLDQQKGSDRVPGKTNGTMKAVLPRYGGKKYTENADVFYRTKSGNIYLPKARRNKRDVWTVTTKPFKEAHFATFPEDLIEPCILAGCQTDGTVLDVFNGSGTTGVVSIKNRRNYIGIELNPEYVKISEKRIQEVQQQIEWQEDQYNLFN